MKYVCFFLLFVSSVSIAQNSNNFNIIPADAQLEAYIPLLKNLSIGLVINATSKIGEESLLDILLANDIHVTKIFVPEHGFRGTEDAGANVDNDTDKPTRIPIISLYGSHKKPNQEDMKGIAILVYDLQDVGTRFYTYISTLQYSMEACAANNVQFLLLDRPNPNGFYVDGPVLEKANQSFVGMQPIPIVYGMTAGEYATMLKGEQWMEGARVLDLKVIKCKNYTHKSMYKLPIAPSPNLRNMAAIYAYPSLCLFEGTVISVGRGTELPFQQYGCPAFEGRFAYRFKPQKGLGAKTAPLYEKQWCYGEQICTTEQEILGRIKNGIQLEWLLNAYQNFTDKTHFFNTFFIKLAGTDQLQKDIEAGLHEKQIKEKWQKDLSEFKRIRKKYLLYEDFE